MKTLWFFLPVAMLALVCGCANERRPNNTGQSGITIGSLADMQIATNRGIITGDLIVRTHDAPNLGLLRGNNEIRGSLIIEYNNALTTLAGLETLAHVRGDLHISYNPVLTTLEGLSGLMSVGGDLLISYNEGLSNLGGLGNLAEVGGSVFIDFNDTLARLDGSSPGAPPMGGMAGAPAPAPAPSAIPVYLDGPKKLISVGAAFSVTYNPLFPTCQAHNLVNQLEDFKGSITICENLPDTCNTAQCF